MASKPHYVAFLLDPSDLNLEFAALPIADASSDMEAVQFGTGRGTERLIAQNIDRAILHIARGGHGTYSAPLTAIV